MAKIGSFKCALIQAHHALPPDIRRAGFEFALALIEALDGAESSDQKELGRGLLEAVKIRVAALRQYDAACAAAWLSLVVSWVEFNPREGEALSKVVRTYFTQSAELAAQYVVTLEKEAKEAAQQSGKVVVGEEAKSRFYAARRQLAEWFFTAREKAAPSGAAFWAALRPHRPR